MSRSFWAVTQKEKIQAQIRTRRHANVVGPYIFHSDPCQDVSMAVIDMGDS